MILCDWRSEAEASASPKSIRTRMVFPTFVFSLEIGGTDWTADVGRVIAPIQGGPTAVAYAFSHRVDAVGQSGTGMLEAIRPKFEGGWRQAQAGGREFELNEASHGVLDKSMVP